MTRILRSRKTKRRCRRTPGRERDRAEERQEDEYADYDDLPDEAYMEFPDKD